MPLLPAGRTGRPLACLSVSRAEVSVSGQNGLWVALASGRSLRDAVTGWERLGMSSTSCPLCLPTWSGKPHKRQWGTGFAASPWGFQWLRRSKEEIEKPPRKAGYPPSHRLTAPDFSLSSFFQPPKQVLPDQKGKPSDPNSLTLSLGL